MYYRRSLKSVDPSKKPGTKRSRVSFSSKPLSPPASLNNPMAVINYYVTVEREAELARNRVVTPPPTPPPPVPTDELPHNTVVALPCINR